MKKFLISNSSYQPTDHICLAYITILINNFPHNNKKKECVKKKGCMKKIYMNAFTGLIRDCFLRILFGKFITKVWFKL